METVADLEKVKKVNVNRESLARSICLFSQLDDTNVSLSIQAE